MAKGKKAYGRVRLTQEHIDLIKKVLHSSLDLSRNREAAARSVEERAFYARIIDRWPDADTARFLELKPGVTPFTEAELAKLLGHLSNVSQPLLEVMRNESDRARIGEMFKDINPLTELHDLLSEPYRLDRSQDPEGEEDAEEGDIT